MVTRPEALRDRVAIMPRPGANQDDTGLRGATEPLEGAKTRIAAIILGVAVLGSGAVGVFVSTNSVGTAALIAAGLVLVAFGMFGSRIQSIEGAGLKLQLQERAATLLEAAVDADNAGRHEAAEQLRDQAEQLLSAAKGVASQYERVRTLEPASAERTANLEALLQHARAMAELAAGPGDVDRLFRTGTEGNRISALAIIQAKPSLADVALINDAVATPRSAFEQYQALRAAEAAAARGLSEDNARSLRTTVGKALFGGDLGAVDSDRCRVAERVLAMLPPPEEADQSE